jgi:glutamine synthetase
MLGSSNSISCANIHLNAAVAEELRQFADKLEKAKDFNKALHDLIKKTIKDHKRIIFNGNGYDDAWIKEATEERGLLNLRTTPDAIPHLMDEKNVKMLTLHKVFTEAELRSRTEITLENYCKQVIIEANTMEQLARRDILPAVGEYAAFVARSAAEKKAVVPELALEYETRTVKRLTELSADAYKALDLLDSVLEKTKHTKDVIETGYLIRDELLGAMAALRTACDEAETLTAAKFWPFPTYDELLFGVR